MAPIHDKFATTHLGNLFMLRLLAFVKDHKATVLDIDEHSARLQVGGRSFADWFHGREYIEKTIIDLSYQPAPQSSLKNPTSRLNVDVSVKPAMFASKRDFEVLASHLLREVRGYFAAV